MEILRSNSKNVGEAERAGSILAGSALVLDCFRRRSFAGLLEGIVGAGLLYRGTIGHCALYNLFDFDSAKSRRVSRGTLVQKRIVVNRPPQQVYEFWRNLENLARFMENLQSVTILDDRLSHWIVRTPIGSVVAWDAEITEDVPGHHIAWRSTESADVPNSGAVGFRPRAGGNSTEVNLSLQYRPPGGRIGATLAKIFGDDPNSQVEEDLRRLKQFVELS